MSRVEIPNTLKAYCQVFVQHVCHLFCFFAAIRYLVTTRSLLFSLQKMHCYRSNRPLSHHLPIQHVATLYTLPYTVLRNACLVRVEFRGLLCSTFPTFFFFQLFRFCFFHFKGSITKGHLFPKFVYSVLSLGVVLLSTAVIERSLI